jgi:uncharacterized protein (DUF58 family)
VTTVRQTHRWRGVAAVAVLLSGVGLLGKRPLLVLAGTVGVGFALYPRLSGPPTVDLDLDRRLDDRDAAPGDRVEVTVTVTNRRRWPLFDVRIVDGVPSMVEVIDGPARHGTVLPPGGSSTFSYAVRAARGAHQFRPATVLVRDLSGGTEVEMTVADEDELVCRSTDPAEAALPDPSRIPGAVPSGSPGGGVEFAQRRDYRPGDALGRIDWTHLGKTGELATVEYTRERDVRVTVCVDARSPSYVGQHGAPNAVAHSLAAAVTLLEGYRRSGAAVGLAAVGRQHCFRPARRRGDLGSLRSVMGTHPTLSPSPPGSGFRPETDHAAQFAEIRSRLGPNDQVVLLSPLADPVPVEAATKLDAAAITVTVVSPDVTATGSTGARVARAERAHRIARLRRWGFEVADWDPAEPLALAVQRSQGRRSR